MGQVKKEMSVSDLSDIYRLFGLGLIFGGILSTIPFMIGYVINGVWEIMK